MPRPLDPVEQAMLQNLRTMAGGMDPATGMSLSSHDRIQAAERYTAFLQKLESIDAWHEKQRLEEEKQKHGQAMEEGRLQLDGSKVNIDARHEDRRIDLEYEKLQVQKAEVVIRALEIAARNPDLLQLTGVVKELSLRLLGGEVVPSLALEDKEQKNS